MLNADLKKKFISLAEVPDNNTDLLLDFYRLAPAPIADYYKHLYVTVGGATEVVKRRYLRTGSDFDFESLATCVPGTLGHAWYHHIKDNGLYPDLLGHPGLKLYPPDSDMYIATCRSLEIHDLLHVISDHQVDAYGEWGVASFTASQRYSLTGLTWWPLLCTRVALVVPQHTLPLMDMLADNWLRGINAADMISADWENMLDWPLEKVKAELKVAPSAPRDSKLIASTNGPFLPRNPIAPELTKLFWELVEEGGELSSLIQKIPVLLSLHDEKLRENYRAEMFRHAGVAQVLENGRATPPLDMAKLANCATGTLGRAVHERLSANEPKNATDLNTELERARAIWAVYLGLSDSDADRVRLQAFQWAQIGDPFSANLLAVLVMRGVMLEPQKLPVLLKTISQGWWEGRRSQPLLALRWDKHWGTPVTELRVACQN